jgi:two-component system cell cycle response regulator DivK
MSAAQAAANHAGTLVGIKPGEATILVVEDTISNFILIVRMLSFMGVQHCEWKPSGWQVVPFASTLPAVHLILLDLRLPYENGYNVLKKIRANARLTDTIVCAVTAQVGEEEMIRAQRAGFDGFIGKPLDPDRFPDQIRRLLAREHVWEWK